RLTPLIGLLISVPSVVSITSLGPISGSGSAGAGSTDGRAVSEVRGVSVGLRVVSFGARAVVPTLRGGALRERGVRAAVDGFAFSAVKEGFSTGDSVGFASGDGAGTGVGDAATSVTGGSGSTIVAPTD